MYYSAHYTSPVGPLVLACGEKNLVGLWLAGQKYFGLPETAVEQENHPVFRLARDWLDRYFAGKRPAPSELPLAPQGSEFRRRVWDILCRIPYGQVTTYGAIAKELAVQMDRPHMSAQAVGGAVGHNPISIIIPCHRVVGADGGLTGYAGGIEVKQALLEWESTGRALTASA